MENVLSWAIGISISNSNSKRTINIFAYILFVHPAFGKLLQKSVKYEKNQRNTLCIQMVTPCLQRMFRRKF